MPNIKSIQDTLNSIYHRFLYYDDQPKDVIEALKINLPHIAPNSWLERIEIGGVYLNGKTVEKNETLPLPCKLEYYEPKAPLNELLESFPKFQEDFIIYEDDFLIVAYKPAGLACQKAKEQNRISLFAYLNDYASRTVHMPSRLDFSTAGIVLASKNPDYHNKLQLLFSNKLIRKSYLCEIGQVVDWKEKHIKNFITKDELHPVLRNISDQDGKPAETIFKLEKNRSSSAIIFAQPITGRTHQIRVHTRYSLGSGIVGDRFYDGQPADTLHLLSYSLEFEHPATRKAIQIQLPDHLMPKWISCKRD